MAVSEAGHICSDTVLPPCIPAEQWPLLKAIVNMEGCDAIALASAAGIEPCTNCDYAPLVAPLCPKTCGWCNASTYVGMPSDSPSPPLCALAPVMWPCPKGCRAVSQISAHASPAKWRQQAAGSLVRATPPLARAVLGPTPTTAICATMATHQLPTTHVTLASVQVRALL